MQYVLLAPLTLIQTGQRRQENICPLRLGSQIHYFYLITDPTNQSNPALLPGGSKSLLGPLALTQRFLRPIQLGTSASTTMARNQDVSIADIQNMADWSSTSSTFRRFYYKPLFDSIYAQAVLTSK